ncbi:MAG TPA: MBL fold metallo-hydrolase [Polyangiaceae bacterium]|nr:MBL fold metallo-hydrolase [Polyangiaceae bacterium]
MRRAWSIEGNSQRLDGGAMFGNAPRALWKRWIAPDELNRIPLACRALLVEEPWEGQERRILFETGIGAYLEPKLRERYGVVEERHVLLDNLDALGLSHEQIDVVVLSHLHFDHAGGLLAAHRPDGALELLFPNAHFVVSRGAWERALEPHPRDRASFIPGLPALLEASGRLEIVETAKRPQSGVLGDDYRIHLSDGHTPGLMLVEIPAKDGPILYAGDLVPGTPWVHLPITMGYDRYPELLIDEKKRVLDELLERRGRLFFTHDAQVALARVACDDRGRYGVEEPLGRVVALDL